MNPIVNAVALLMAPSNGFGARASRIILHEKEAQENRYFPPLPGAAGNLVGLFHQAIKLHLIRLRESSIDSRVAGNRHKVFEGGNMRGVQANVLIEHMMKNLLEAHLFLRGNGMDAVCTHDYIEGRCIDAELDG